MTTSTAIRGARGKRIGPQRILLAAVLALAGAVYMTAAIAPAANAGNPMSAGPRPSSSRSHATELALRECEQALV